MDTNLLITFSIFILFILFISIYQYIKDKNNEKENLKKIEIELEEENLRKIKIEQEKSKEQEKFKIEIEQQNKIIRRKSNDFINELKKETTNKVQPLNSKTNHLSNVEKKAINKVDINKKDELKEFEINKSQSKLRCENNILKRKKHYADINLKYINIKKDNFIDELNKIKTIHNKHLDSKNETNNIIYNLKNTLVKYDNNFFYRSDIKNSIKYYFLFDYLSNYNLKNFEEHSILYENIRRLTFKFKDGIYDKKLIKFIADSLLLINPKIYKNSDFYICIIPSSKIHITEIRYKKFIQELAQELNINDGFNLITRTHDIEKSVQDGIKKNINVLEGISFSNKLKNKNIILIDDVITKGNSLYAFYNALNENNNNIIPLFISRTYYNKDYNIDHMYNINNINYLTN